MFVAILRFSAQKAQAGQWMDEHKSWLQQGFDDGVFVLSGSLSGGAGGAILAQGLSREDLDARLVQDPFVIHDVVTTEVIEMAVSKADARLDFLKN